MNPLFPGLFRARVGQNAIAPVGRLNSENPLPLCHGYTNCIVFSTNDKQSPNLLFFSAQGKDLKLAALFMLYIISRANLLKMLIAFSCI